MYTQWRQYPNLPRLLILAILGLLLGGALLHSSGTVDMSGQWDRLSQLGMTGGKEAKKAQNKAMGPIGDGMPIRIMFMGASVTRGEMSTDNLGYRKQVRDWLVSIGNPVNAVGSVRFGKFKDNDVEGWGAARMRVIYERAEKHLPELQPNLVLIQAGTSDCWQKDDPVHIFQRTKNLVNMVLEKANQSTVIMSTIITTPNMDVEPCVLSGNAQIRQVAQDLRREGKPVDIAEMHHDQGLPDRVTPQDIIFDRIHPSDEGYFKMGRVFIEKIRDVDAEGFLRPPVDNGIMTDGDLEKDILEEEAKKQAENNDGKPGEKKPLLRRRLR